jgi:hypothetical protein
MKPLLLLFTVALLLAQEQQVHPPALVLVEGIGDTSGVATPWPASYKTDPSKVQWTAQQFKEYCGTLTECKIPDDVEVLADDETEPAHDDQVSKLRTRVETLEQAVLNQHFEILQLQRDVLTLQGR